MPTPIPGTSLVAVNIGPYSTDPQKTILLEQLAWLTGPVAQEANGRLVDVLIIEK